MEADANENYPKTWKLVALLLAITLVWAGSGLVLYTLKERGEFGDMFGAINALFSGLAFATLIYTIYLQRAELRLQRLELTLTRAELEGQKLQISAQNDLMRADGFENSFFQVLRIFSDIVNSIDIVRSTDRTMTGRDCFSFFYQTFRNGYMTTRSTSPKLSEEEVIARVYAEFYKRHQGDVGHYFRTLYNLVKLVDRSSIVDKHFYTNLIRAQLSSHELLLLFYNCQTTLGRDQFKPLLEKYALLKTVPFELLANIAHKDLFEPGAYGKVLVVEAH